MIKKRRYVPDLVSDMAVCDANFLRLHRLFPSMFEDESIVIGVRDTTDELAIVTIQVKSQHPYTTILSIQVESEIAQPWIKWPRLEARVYQDLNTAEVISIGEHRNLKPRYPTPNPHMYQPDEKSQINRFFGELLNFCLLYGHALDRTVS